MPLLRLCLEIGHVLITSLRFTLSVYTLYPFLIFARLKGGGYFAKYIHFTVWARVGYNAALATCL
jgi:hypothetical protein